jgi:hypothetical protein
VAAVAKLQDLDRAQAADRDLAAPLMLAAQIRCYSRLTPPPARFSFVTAANFEKPADAGADCRLESGLFFFLPKIVLP